MRERKTHQRKKTERMRKWTIFSLECDMQMIFLGNVINSSIICLGLITIHNPSHKAVQTHRTLSSEEPSEE